MLTQKSLILALAATFFVPGSNGQTLGESMALPFARTTSKALVTPQKPFLEISSTEGVYISEGHAFALADTQCLHTETPHVQLCFGNRWPTRLRLLPHEHLKIGLHSLGLSQLKYTHHPSFVTEALFPGQEALPELNPVARAIVTKILQSVERPREIMANAKQRSLRLLHLNNHKNNDILFEAPLGEDDTGEDSTKKTSTEEDDESIEWWGIEKEELTSDRDVIQVRLNDDIPLKPDTNYCFVPDPGTETRTYRQAAPTEGSGGEGDSSSDENSDSEEETKTDSDSDVKQISTTADSVPVTKEISESCLALEPIKQADENSDSEEEETKTDTDSDVEQISTTADLVPITKEISESRAALELIKQEQIKQKPISNSEIPTGSQGAAAATDSTYQPLPYSKVSLATRTHSGKKPHPYQERGKTFIQSAHLKRHSSDTYLCQICSRPFVHMSALKKHQRVHLKSLSKRK